MSKFVMTVVTAGSNYKLYLDGSNLLAQSLSTSVQYLVVGLVGNGTFEGGDSTGAEILAILKARSQRELQSVRLAMHDLVSWQAALKNGTTGQVTIVYSKDIRGVVETS